MHYRRLGRSGLKVSEISLGCLDHILAGRWMKQKQMN